jgi:hypothetical protein
MSVSRRPKSKRPRGAGRRAGTGETVSRSVQFATFRPWFIVALETEAPHVAERLRSDDALAVWTGFESANLTPWLDADTIPAAVHEAQARLTAFIENWQRRYWLRDLWLYWAALATIKVHAAGSTGRGLVLPLPENAPKPYEGRKPIPEKPQSNGTGPLASITLTAMPRHPAGPEDVHLDDLYIPGHFYSATDAYGTIYDAGWSDERNEDPVHIGQFDTRMETIDTAVGRILPVLESRLRMALERIRDADIAEAGGLPVITKRTAEHMRWLVRRQVWNHSFTEIAKANKRSVSNVSGPVRETARLIDLTLRPDVLPGRNAVNRDKTIADL